LSFTNSVVTVRQGFETQRVREARVATLIAMAEPTLPIVKLATIP
jgi:hypothetical protein